ncbi:MAG: gamma carbonic anhydrase family protein [candidate division KSB1 bacterium]|nr:gamma carbonic anhydrase family protein [candidate division KSB1 bacterium]MDQ7064257.1 gamma carbonic anhydrase family protein [candidate division KSB1 bacterium]
MIHAHHGVEPKFDTGVFVAPNAVIIGDVHLGKNVSVWFNVTMRGDVNYIRIGDMTNIQDGTVCHVTLNKWPLVVGKGVTVGHGAIIHGCVIKDYCLIGMGATILDGAEIGPFSIVAAGSLVREGQKIPPSTLAAGVPAEVKRVLRPEEQDALVAAAERYMKYKNEYLAMGIQHPGISTTS